MTLRVYDTLRQKKVPFEPVHPGRVGMYYCGMTVQDRPHMGHMLAFVAGDMIRRYLEYLGYEVTYVQNFTDIDDKIIARAQEEGVDYRVVAERNIRAYHEAARALGIRPATVYPLATEHIDEIVALIERLVEKGHAYAAGRDVYFRVRTMPDYGKLSKRNVDDLKAGARIEVDEQKEDPLDFALWKGSDPPEPGWESPWGRGRPGWHIECSAMSMKYLGETLDFHGGGEDLIFPHHENELAQSECATGRPFVNHWLHNGLLHLRGEKMSKSTGNFFAMDDVLREFPGGVVRFYLLSTHFRSQSEFSRDRLEEARRGYERIVNAVRLLDERRRNLGDDAAPVVTPPARELIDTVGAVRERFLAAMDDDFNSAAAIGQVFELVRAFNAAVDRGEGAARSAPALEAVAEAFELFDRILGLFPQGMPRADTEVPDEIRCLVDERQQARRARDFARADALRDEIVARGYVVEDTPDGVRVRRAGNGA